MKLWLDDLRPAPEGYIWVKTVYDAIEQICRHNADFDYCWKVYICGCCIINGLNPNISLGRRPQII